MGGVASAAGRLVDAATTMTQLNFQPSAADQTRLRNLVAAIASIRDDLIKHRVPHPIQFQDHNEAAGGQPFAPAEDGAIVLTLIPAAFAGSLPEDESSPFSDGTQRVNLLAPDAFTNPEHFQFALKGCLAASLCYMLYNFVAWPGISTAVTTCLLTALTTIGSSRQKQILRFAGALVGGVVVGMGSQIFILPYVDSISGFTVIFIVVTAFSSWITAASPRLSYFRVCEVAFARII